MHVLQEAPEEGGAGLNLLLLVGLALESRKVLVRSPPASNSGKSARDMSIFFADFTARGLPLLVRRAELLNHLLVRNVVGVLLQGLLFARSNVSLLSNVYESS